MIRGGAERVQNEAEDADRMDGNVGVGAGREGEQAQFNQCFRMAAEMLLLVCVCVCWEVGGGDSLEGETWFSSLEITSTRRLLGRNIKIQPDISQVFYHGLSDPIPLLSHFTHT